MSKEQKQKSKKQGETRVIVFTAIVAIIVIVTIIIIVVNVNKKNNVDQKEPDSQISENIGNPDAKPEDKPSISGNENVNVVDGVKVNNSSKISSDKTFGKYKFTNIKLEATSTGTVLTAKVSSSSASKIAGKDIVIKFYNNSGTLVSMMNAYIGQIKPGETIDFRCESTSDLSNAYDMKIE